MANSSEIYKITFLNKGKVYEVFVKQVYQSDLYGFVEVEDYVFDEKKQVVVDPTEEKLKSEFTGVKRSFIPMQAIIRIDEVEKVVFVKLVTEIILLPSQCPSLVRSRKPRILKVASPNMTVFTVRS